MTLKKQIVWSVIGGLLLSIAISLLPPLMMRRTSTPPLTDKECFQRFGGPCPMPPLVAQTFFMGWPIRMAVHTNNDVVTVTVYNWLFWSAMLFAVMRGIGWLKHRKA